MNYFSGQGAISYSIRSSGGLPQGFTYLGNCTELTLNLGKNYARDTSYGSETLAPFVRSSEVPNFALTLEELSADNLALIMYGSVTTIAAGATSESLVVYTGKANPVGHIGLTAWTALTNSGNTVTYVQGTDYTIDLPAGVINIPATGSAITNGQTLNAYYTKGAHSKISLGTVKPPMLWMRFEGVNTANNNAPVVVDLYKCRLYPVENLPLIVDNFVGLKLSARLFKDPVHAVSLADGQYMRMRQTA